MNLRTRLVGLALSMALALSPLTSVLATDAYVQNSGQAAIDLGYRPGSNTCIVVDFRVMTLSGSTAGRILGVNDSTFSVELYEGSSFGYSLKDGSASAKAFSPAFSHERARHRATLDSYRGYAMLDEVSFSNKVATTRTKTSDLTLAAFARHTKDGYTEFSKSRIYSLQIYERGALVRDFVPTNLPSVGLCDRLSGEFHGPVSGSLSYHAADPDPEPLDWGPVWTKGEKLRIESAASEVRYFYRTQEVARLEAVVAPGKTVELNGMDMSRIVTESVDGRIAGRDYAASHKQYRKYVSNGANGVFTRSPDFWAKDVRTDCLGVWNSNKDGLNKFSGTLVTPRHALFAKHCYIGSSDDKVTNYYYGVDGTVVSSPTRSSGGAVSDIYVGLLASDIPATVKPAYILPENPSRWFRSGLTVPTLMFDQYRNGNIFNQSTSSLTGSSVSGSTPTENDRERLYQAQENGCSASPRFLVIGQDVILLNLSYSYSMGQSIAYYRKDVQTKMDALSTAQKLNPADYRLRPYDFTPWMPRIILSEGKLSVSGGGTFVVKAPLVWEGTLEITVAEGSTLRLDPAGCPLSYADRKRVRVNGHYLGLEEDDGTVFPASVEPPSPEEAGKGYAALDDGVLRLTLFEGANLSELVDASQLAAIRGGEVSNIAKFGAGSLTNDVELADYQGRWEIRRGNLVLVATNALGSGAVEMRSSGSVRFAVESAWENDFSFTSGVDPTDTYSLLLLKPTAFNGNVTSTRGLVVKCKNSAGKATFNGAVTLPRTDSTAILYSYPGGYNASGKYDILYRGPVTAYKMDGGTSPSGSHGYVRLYSQQNSIGYLHANYHCVELAGTNCASGAILSMGYNELNANRSGFTVSADNEVGGLTTTLGFFGSGDNAAHTVKIVRGARLTLRARQTFSTDAKFTGAGTLAWQPTYDSYQLSLISNRVHTLSGTIDMGSGRLQLVAGTTLDQLSVLRMSRLAKLTVNDAKALELKEVDYDGDRLSGGLYTPENCPWVTKGAVQVADGPIVRVSKTQDGFRLEVSNTEAGMSVVFVWGTFDGGDDPANWANRSEVTVTSGSATVPYPPGWGDGASNRARAFILSEGKVISASEVQRPATSLAVTFE